MGWESQAPLSVNTAKEVIVIYFCFFTIQNTEDHVLYLNTNKKR
jgi:hypothetical protein